MPIRLTPKQYRVIAIAIVVAAASFLIGWKYFSHAFPEAAIQFRVDRGSSRQIAQQFLAARGFHLENYRQAAVFSYDDMAKLYLERTQGLKRMDQLARGPLHLWRWSHRWFKPFQKEEFRVEVTPEGKVVGFDHEIPEDARGANLAQPQARAIAEHFLSQEMKRDLSDLEFVDAEQRKRPARTDYVFTWKQKSVNLGNGSLRVAVRVDGDQIAGYQEFVKIPEDWLRGYQKLRSRNIAAQIVDQVFWVFLSIAMLVILVRKLRDHDAPLRLALGFGLVAAALAFLSQLNSFPLAKFSYPTTDSYSSFLSSYVFEALLGGLGLGVLIFLLVASSEPVYRESFPGFVSFRRYFTWRGLRTRSFLMANIVGISLTFFFFAYQTVFYLLANHLGAWAPADIPFSNQLNTRIPWVAVLFTGFFPAVSEEMQFRAFAIPFLKKITRSWPLALALAAFNWGFLHSAYPNEPFFIRGVEVGVGGIIVGIIMLRFGILATLMWHYSVDALYTAFLLLRSPNHYLMISGGLSAGIMLIPLIVALTAYLGTGTFADESQITNANAGVVRAARIEEAAEVESINYQPLSKRRLLAAGCVIVIFFVLGAIRVYRLGQGIKIHMTRRQAMQTAVAFLQARHVSVASYHSVAWLDANVDPLALRYMLQRLSVERTDQVMRQATQPLLWEVRFFKPLQKEEYRVFVDVTDGRVFSYRHLLDEASPGASLTPEQALALGEKALAAHGYSLADFALQDTEAQKRKAREDYTLVWQAKPGDPRNVGDAHYRLEVRIAGDQVVGFSRHFKLPEQWLRQQETSRLANSVLLGLEIAFGALLIAGAVWLFVRQVRHGKIRWVRSLKVAIVFALILALAELDQLPLLARLYDTSISFSNFELQIAVGLITAIVLGGLALWLVVALVTSLYPDAWKILRASARRVWRRDAAVALLVGIAVAFGMDKILALLANHFHAYVAMGFFGSLQAVNTALPGLDVFLRSLIYSVGGASVVGVAIYGALLGWRRRAWWFWAGLILLLVALGPGGAHSVAEYAVNWMMRFLPLVAGIIVLAVFFRNNPLAYVASAFASAVAAPLVELFSQPNSFARWNGAALAVLAAVVLTWLLAPISRARRADAG
jgi:membrane protease YdiL (CAAX protease family)